VTINEVWNQNWTTCLLAKTNYSIKKRDCGGGRGGGEKDCANRIRDREEDLFLFLLAYLFLCSFFFFLFCLGNFFCLFFFFFWFLNRFFKGSNFTKKEINKQDPTRSYRIVSRIRFHRKKKRNNQREVIQLSLKWQHPSYVQYTNKFRCRPLIFRVDKINNTFTDTNEQTW